ncbi:hypothetical protein NKR19_g10123 [Coniochaeta hoffmannii]|uniref:Uncharacterized protein n=1 Tax=Coniochaeta hoffmannii TaxID=91930 RepID=A0AA38R987_9PEZI|nr:hypothetical protein NKR19_g10123 [Coniochaeta hoffmannii]
MGKSGTYHKEQTSLRRKHKPHKTRVQHDSAKDDSNVNKANKERQDNDPDDDNVRGFNPADLHELRDCLEEETQPPKTNIWNPDGYTNNCAYLGLANVTSKSVEKIEGDMGRLPEHADCLPDEYLAQAAEHYGVRITNAPPPEEYFRDGGKASALYRDGTVGHIVEYEHGDFEPNMTFRDYQRYGHGEDATDNVRRAGEKYYMHKYHGDSDDEEGGEDATDDVQRAGEEFYMHTYQGDVDDVEGRT